MVNLGLIIAGAVLAAVVFFRKELGETGALLGGGFGAFGKGVQTGVSGILSPQIRPAFVPTIGFNIEGGFGTTATGEPRTAPPGSNVPQGCVFYPLTVPCPSGWRDAGLAFGPGAIGKSCCPPDQRGEEAGFQIGGPPTPESRIQEIRYTGRTYEQIVSGLSPQTQRVLGEIRRISGVVEASRLTGRSTNGNF